MNVCLVYFSQTGNTLKIAEAMADALRGEGHTVTLMPMQRIVASDIEGCDVLGVGSPVFESQIPTPVGTWLRSGLPDLGGKPAFVFATSVASTGSMLHQLTKAVRARGATVIGGFMGRGTNHHPCPSLSGRMPGRPNETDIERARAFALAVARHVGSGTTGPMPESRPDALKATFGFYQTVGLIVKPFLLRILLHKPAVDRTRCTTCGLCAEECPMSAITLDPYPVIGGSCIRCYHCQNGCPEEAMSEPWAFGNVVISIFYNKTFARRFGDLEAGEEL